MGSNLDDPPAQLRRALGALAAVSGVRVECCSPFYRNPPMGPADQPDFLNAVAGLLTTLAPEALLERLRAIEDAQGRRRDGPRWGPRTLDLDLLLHGATQLDGETLTLPHPGLVDRPFVLVPLADAAPGLRLPDGRLVAALARACDRSSLHRMAA